MTAVNTDEHPAVGFLSRVWPEANSHCLATLMPGGKMRHHWVPSAGDAARIAKQIDDAGGEVYFGTAGFRENKRRASCVEAVKVLYADIDVGEGKGYTSIEQALAALKQWCDSTGVPWPSLIVVSGRGLHIYWLLRNAIPLERWQALADRLKSLMQATGFKADPSRTADSASLLRVPGTHNHKGDPLPVYVLHDDHTVYPAEDMDKLLPLAQPRAVNTGAESTWTAGMEREFPPANVERITAGCAQMRAAYDVRCDSIEEPYWRAVLSVLKRCENGDSLIHEWSVGDERYDPHETAKKASETTGPHTCDQFESCNPGGCAGCPVRGKIGSPILLGTELAEPEVREDDVAADERLNEVGDFRVAANGVFTLVLNEDTGVEERKKVTACPLWVVETRERARADDEPDRSSLHLQWHPPGGGTRHATIYQHEVHDLRAFTKWLSDHNLVSMVFNVRMLQVYISQYTLALIRSGRIHTYYDRLGWFGDSFVMAGRRVTPEGILPARVQSTPQVTRQTPPEAGDINEWVKAIAVLDRPGLEGHRFAVLAGFASPLLHLAGWTSAVLALSGTSGTGKTTGAMAACSIFADPTQMVYSPATTMNALYVSMGAHAHVPLFVDELSRWGPDNIVSFAYAGPNGEGKGALNQNRTMQDTPKWELTPIVTTNRPISDYPEKDIDEPVKRRVLELHFDRQHMLTTEEAEVVHAGIKAHYALPGLCFMHYIVSHPAEVREALRAAEAYITANTRLDGADRFQRWLLAAAMVGGMIARQLGLVSFDIAATVMYAANRAELASQEVETEEVRLVDLMADFTVQFRDRIVRWDHNDRTKETLTFPTVDAERDPVARYCMETKRLSVRSSVLKDYLLEHRLSLTNLTEWMRQHGVSKTRVHIYPGGGQPWCHVLPTDTLGIEMGET